MTKKPPPPVSGSLGSLGDLLRARGVPAGSAPPVEPAASPPADVPPATPVTPELARAGRLIVRRERKGHGGKAVTVIDGLALPASALEALARTMRKALGCGSWVDGGRIVLQGDRAEAVVNWLQRYGARQVQRAN